MAVEGLRAAAVPRVPSAHGLVRRAGREAVGEGLPAHLVHRVHVPAKRHPAPVRLKVPQARAVVERTRRDEVAAVVEARVPHRLPVLRERHRASLLFEVPNLHRAVSRRRDQMRPRGVKADAGDPVFVAVAAHDQIPARQVPHLPRRVVRRGRDDGLLRVQREVRDGHHVALEGLLQREVLHGHRVEFDVGERVLPQRRLHHRVAVLRGHRHAHGRPRSLLLRDRGGGSHRVLLGLLGARFLGETLLLFRRRGALLLLLGALKLSDFRRHLVALELRQHLALHRELVLSLQFNDRGLVLRVVLPKTFDVREKFVLLLDDALVM
eukprot:31210-Pelagococcus_subviridis.AAC.10